MNQKTIETIRPYVSRGQLAVMRGTIEHTETSDRLAETLRHMPSIYSQEEVGEMAIVHLHYFRGASDWWLTEKNSAEEAFGFVCLNGWKDSAECGYVSIEELVAGGVDCDLFWTPKTLREVMAEVRGETVAEGAIAG